MCLAREEEMGLEGRGWKGFNGTFFFFMGGGGGGNEGLRRFGEQYYSSKPLISNSLELAEFGGGGEEFYLY
jgi:hypothetical protein